MHKSTIVIDSSLKNVQGGSLGSHRDVLTIEHGVGDEETQPHGPIVTLGTYLLNITRRWLSSYTLALAFVSSVSAITPSLSHSNGYL